MSQHKNKTRILAMVLVLCTVLLGSCIHPDEGDFETTNATTTQHPQETTATIPLETLPDETTDEATIPTVTPPAETTTPPEETTTPPQTTTEPQETTPIPTETTTVFEETTTVPEETTTVPEETTTPPEETTTEQPGNQDTPDEDEKIKIYIDQGHNPKQYDSEGNSIPSWNTGAQGNGLDEAELTYEIGMLLYELLMQDGRFEVRMSRPTADTVLGTDNNSALDYRVNDAAEWGADYFISLHINAFTSDTVTGLEVYTADGDDVGYALGEDILNSLVKATELRKRGMKDGSNLRVLKNAQMPAVLVEMGFISNPSDAAMLDESPEVFAQGIYDGIVKYFADVESGTQELCFCMTCCKTTALKFVSDVLPQILFGANTMNLVQGQTNPLSLTTSIVPQEGESILSAVCTSMLSQSIASPFLRFIPQIGIWLLIYLVQTL